MSAVGYQSEDVKFLAVRLVDFYDDFDTYDAMDVAEGDAEHEALTMYRNLQDKKYVSNLSNIFEDMDEDVPEDMYDNYLILKKDVADYARAMENPGVSFDSLMRTFKTSEESVDVSYRKGNDEITFQSYPEETNGRIRRQTRLYENGAVVYSSDEKALRMYESLDDALSYLKDQYRDTKGWIDVETSRVSLQNQIVPPLSSQRGIQADTLFSSIMDKLGQSREQDNQLGE